MRWLVFDDSNIARYKNFIDSNENSGIWHDTAWLGFQKASGKVIDGFYFGVEDDGKIILAGLLLIHKSAFGNYGYIPAGILYEKINENIYGFFLTNLGTIAKKKGLFFTQTDSILPYTGEFHEITSRHKNHIFNQKLPIPRFSTMINLSSPLDKIMDNMKPKGRYNIKLAEKKQVKIKIGSSDDIPVFYDILKETSARDGFNNRNPESYYRLMLEKIKDSVLIIATHESDMLCANIFTFTKNQGLYYYGASSNNKRNLMAPYLVQWEAIRMAKERNCGHFDFMGIADPEDPDDKLRGVTEFKLKFGGDVVKFQPSFHIVHNRFAYSASNLIKGIRSKL
jgi:peptidoglycan pentaglycine glycine transferase (the first glycine)